MGSEGLYFANHKSASINPEVTLPFDSHSPLLLLPSPIPPGLRGEISSDIVRRTKPVTIGLYSYLLPLIGKEKTEYGLVATAVGFESFARLSIGDPQ